MADAKTDSLSLDLALKWPCSFLQVIKLIVLQD